MEEPKVLKHYEIMSRLGEGGMGIVYQARDMRLGRLVALKMLPGDLAASEERSKRFEREARIVSALSHPGIATLYDFDRDGETTFLTMELVQGANLREVIADGPMGLPDAIECGVQVSEALAAAHKGGVVHRDLKPENIMAAESGYYKVLDFGVARLEDTSRTATPSTETPTRTWATKAGTMLGTVAYMSPEQIMGQPTDARSDIFSLGSVLYELVTAEQAFGGPSDIAVAHAIAYESARPVDDASKEIPGGLAAVIDKCLAKKPEDRYQTAEDLACDLRTVRMNRLSGMRETRGLLAHEPRLRPGWRTWIGIAGAAVVVGMALVGWRLVVTPEADLAGLRPPPLEQRLVHPADRSALLARGPARPRVVVAFFENNTGDAQADWISRGLPEMLTTDLSRSAGLDVIATQRLHDLLASAGRDAAQGLDRSTTAELARWAGAEVVISGSVFRSGARYRIDAQAYDTASGTVLTAYKAEGTDLFPLVNQLTAGLLEGLSVSVEEQKRAAVTLTNSKEAFEAFVTGRDHYEGLAFADAEEALRRSLAADPEFAVARLHLAMSRIYSGEVEQAIPQLDQLADRAEALPEAERLLALALGAFYRDDDPEAGTGYIEQLTERFPENVHAYVWWGRALADLGEEPLEATRKLRRALEQDPNNLLAIAALANQLAQLGATEKAQAMLAEAREANPGAAAELTRRIESY